MRFSLALVAIVALALLTERALAQTIDELVPDFSPQEQADLGRAFGTYASAITVFTGRNAASSGNFSFDDDGGDISIVHIPVSTTFGEEGDRLRLNLRGAFGRFEARTSVYDFFNLSEELRAEDPEVYGEVVNAPDFRKDWANSLSIGAGVVYEPLEGLQITPSFDLIWTHVKRRFDYNNLVSGIVGLKYDRDLFNLSTESITYSPSLEISYQIILACGYSVTPSVTYTHLWTEDLWSKSRFAHFSIDSSVLQGQVTANIPLPFSITSGETDLRPFFKASNLHGAVQNSLEEDSIFDLGTNIAFDVSSDYIDELIVGAAYITASDLEGYRINLEAAW